MSSESESTTPPEALQQHDKPNVQIVYETTSAVFANQVIVNSGRDQIILDFSTGVISDHATGRHVLPIQQRTAMTLSNAVRLVQTLTNVINQVTAANQEAMAKEAEARAAAAAAAEEEK